MNIIDCQKIREEILKEAKIKLTKIFGFKGIVTKLVIVQVEGDFASDIYIKNKIKTAEECGIEVEHIKLPNDIKLNDLRRVIISANNDMSVTGIMLQLPLPEHLKKYEQSVIDLISYKKDVDGLTTESVGRLWTNKSCLKPCTAEGVMRLLPQDLSGKTVVIINRSSLVGKPLIKMIIDKNGTPIVCHSKTNKGDLEHLIDYADIIITAVGIPKFINKENFSYEDKKIIIDVAINKLEGKLCGDVDLKSIKEINNFEIDVTPTPNGTGILTTAQLMLNVALAYELQQ